MTHARTDLSAPRYQSAAPARGTGAAAPVARGAATRGSRAARSLSVAGPARQADPVVRPGGTAPAPTAPTRPPAGGEGRAVAARSRGGVTTRAGRRASLTMTLRREAA